MYSQGNFLYKPGDRRKHTANWLQKYKNTIYVLPFEMSVNDATLGNTTILTECIIFIILMWIQKNINDQNLCKYRNPLH